jgi:hypothetical protein
LAQEVVAGLGTPSFCDAPRHMFMAAHGGGKGDSFGATKRPDLRHIAIILEFPYNNDIGQVVIC